MNTLFLSLVITVIAIVILVALKGRSKFSELPYAANVCLMSPAEWAFFGVLVQAAGQDGVVFAKVRVADVMMPVKDIDRSKWQAAFNAISAKHFDFLVCSPADSAILAAFELDDASHGSKKRQRRDRFLEGACEVCGLPLIRIKAARSYVMTDIRDRFTAAVGRKGAQGPVPVLAKDSGKREGSSSSSPGAELTQTNIQQPNVKAGTQNQYHDQTAPNCPKCGAPMLRRTTRSGANAGRQFWGCSAYPGCRSILQDVDRQGT